MRVLNYLYLIFFISSACYSQQHYTNTMRLMGCDFKITVVADNENEGQEYIKIAVAEIIRIERLISSWDSNSETSMINTNAGVKPVIVANELFELINRSKQISQLTNGAFDISYASMDKIWKFDGSVTKLPSQEKVKESVKKVGYENIVLDVENNSVFLKNIGVKIGFGAIGKGYAADKAKQLLVNKGVKGGIINASGDLTTWGKQPDGKSWLVGIKNPLNKNKIFAWFPVENKAVVTSGNYEKFLLINNQRYSHIINPKTGYPSKGVISTSVFAPKAELADALATSIFVLGVEKGLYFINQLTGVDCIIVTDKGEIHYSNNIKNEIKKK